MLTLYLRQRIADRRAEIIIGIENPSLQIKFDDRKGLVHGGELRLGISTGQLLEHSHLSNPSGIAWAAAAGPAPSRGWPWQIRRIAVDALFAQQGSSSRWALDSRPERGGDC